MVFVKPMKKIKVSLCAFGIFMGMVFPLYASFFIEWIPKRRMLFNIGCLIAGYLVGAFAFYIVKVILKNIESYYKKTLSEDLGVEKINNSERDSDLLINMKNEFDTLIKNYSFLVKKENEDLIKLAITDCLTSGYNHRYLYEYFSNRILLGCSQITALFCDIDYFKRINDSYGHVIGDAVLKEVGNIIKETINKNGNYFRFGGEEFVVLLENITSDDAYKIAEDIRINIKNSIEIQSFCNLESITISIGLASYPTDGLNIETLIDKSDKAMYCAKRKGRNKCQVYQE